MRVLSVVGGELAEQVLLLIAELARRNDDNADMLITDAVAAKVRNPLPLRRKKVPVWVPAGILSFTFSVSVGISISSPSAA